MSTDWWALGFARTSSFDAFGPHVVHTCIELVSLLVMKASALLVAFLLEALLISVNGQNTKPRVPLPDGDSESEILKRIKQLEIDVHGNSDSSLDNNVHAGSDRTMVQLHRVALSDEENAMIDDLITKIKNDDQTMDMITKMKQDQGHTLDSMISGMSGPEKVSSLQTILSELQATELLFKDPERALRMMNEDGMIPPDRLPEYQKNPKLLEDDTRKALYFSFVTVAVALGLL